MCLRHPANKLAGLPCYTFVCEYSASDRLLQPPVILQTMAAAIPHGKVMIPLIRSENIVPVIKSVNAINSQVWRDASSK